MDQSLEELWALVKAALRSLISSIKNAMEAFLSMGKEIWKSLEQPKDLYIITTAKKRDQLDWDVECASFRLSKERSASFGGVKVTIDSWNNIPNYTEVKDAFFIFDEQRLVGSGAWVKAFLKVAKVNRWIMLSATPGDTWLDYIPVFVANNFYKNRTEFLRRHVVYNHFTKFPQVDHYVETGHLEKLRRLVTVEMPYAKHTVRHTSSIPVEHSQELFERVFKHRWNIYEDRPIKDVSELFRVMRKLVNSDVSRLTAIMELMEKHDRLIIFYNFNFELEMLRTLATTFDIPMAEWNGHNHQEIPEGKKWLYLVQYTAGAEGWNCVTTNAVVFFSLNYSYKINQQSMGRIDRLNTPYTNLYYYILRSNSMIDLAITKSLAGKKNFNERRFITHV
jgi:hypothetical protein